MTNHTKTAENLDKQYTTKYENLSFTPVFIMGVQRSGTSILYKILAETQSFNIVTAYHLIQYPELIHLHETNNETKKKQHLADYFSQQAQMDRGIDRLKITPDFPEEYGFILAQTSKKSMMTPENYPTFHALCQKIQYISDPTKPILLKNPFDFSNFLFIKKMLPNARFVFIHRNPLKTLNSQLKATRSLLHKKNSYMSLLSPEYNQLFERRLLLAYYRFLHSGRTNLRIRSALKNLDRHTSKIITDIDSLPKEDYINITYEQLCTKPQQNIETIMDFLKYKIEKQPKYTTLIKPRKTKWLPEITKNKEQILDTLESYIHYCNYDKTTLLATLEQ